MRDGIPSTRPGSNTILQAESIAAGRDPSKLSSGHLWPDKIIEVKMTGPSSGSIVWEWDAWDHLIQDYDSTNLHGVLFADPDSGVFCLVVEGGHRGRPRTTVMDR